MNAKPKELTLNLNGIIAVEVLAITKIGYRKRVKLSMRVAGGASKIQTLNVGDTLNIDLNLESTSLSWAPLT